MLHPDDKFLGLELATHIIWTTAVQVRPVASGRGAVARGRGMTCGAGGSEKDADRRDNACRPGIRALELECSNGGTYNRLRRHPNQSPRSNLSPNRLVRHGSRDVGESRVERTGGQLTAPSSADGGSRARTRRGETGNGGTPSQVTITGRRTGLSRVRHLSESRAAVFTFYCPMPGRGPRRLDVRLHCHRPSSCMNCSTVKPASVMM